MGSAAAMEVVGVVEDEESLDDGDDNSGVDLDESSDLEDLEDLRSLGLDDPDDLAYIKRSRSRRKRHEPPEYQKKWELGIESRKRAEVMHKDPGILQDLERATGCVLIRYQSRIYDRGWVSHACFGKLWRALSRLYQRRFCKQMFGRIRWNSSIFVPILIGISRNLKCKMILEYDSSKLI